MQSDAAQHKGKLACSEGQVESIYSDCGGIVIIKTDCAQHGFIRTCTEKSSLTVLTTSVYPTACYLDFTQIVVYL